MEAQLLEPSKKEEDIRTSHFVVPGCQRPRCDRACVMHDVSCLYACEVWAIRDMEVVDARRPSRLTLPHSVPTSSLPPNCSDMEDLEAMVLHVLGGKCLADSRDLICKGVATAQCLLHLSWTAVHGKHYSRRSRCLRSGCGCINFVCT